MKKNINILILLVFVIFTSCKEDTIELLGVGNVTGRVVESESFNPIENAKVVLNPTSNTVFTDAEGYFRFDDVEAGDYSVSATKESFLTAFEPATVTVGIDVNVIFEMDDENSANRPPTTPILSSPEDGIENQELSLQLIWSSSDPEGDDIIYRLEIKNDLNNEVIAVNSITDTTYVVSNLKYGVKYFWQVAATDEINEEVLSSVWSFKTKINPENRFFLVRKSGNENNIIYSGTTSEDDSGVLENEVQLTSSEVNSWRPRKNQAANRIAFLRNINNETHLFTMNHDGSNVQQVTSAVPVTGYNMNEVDFSWSSNGDRLLYPHYGKLYVINKDGSGLQEVYETGDGSFITECDWSNDESVIALKTNDITGYNVTIFTIDMSGNVLDTILSGVQGAAGGLNLSVNNKKLLYTYDVSEYENANNRQLDTRVFIYDFNDGTSIDISHDKSDGTLDLDPRFSPNEAEVIFVNTSNDGISQKDIYKMEIDVDGTDGRELLFVDSIMPDWE